MRRPPIQRPPSRAVAASTGLKIFSNMSPRGSISRSSRHGSPALDDCDLPELQCCCHEPAVRYMYYTENYKRVCFLKCNVTEGCSCQSGRTFSTSMLKRWSTIAQRLQIIVYKMRWIHLPTF